MLTNYLGLSVGGTLAVGGIGGTSSRRGMQTDQVVALDVVTGEGRELKCSRELNADLFDAIRGGLAQCGIITRATLRLERCAGTGAPLSAVLPRSGFACCGPAPRARS